MSASVSRYYTSSLSYVVAIYLRQVQHPNILTFLKDIFKETAVTILCNLVKVWFCMHWSSIPRRINRIIFLLLFKIQMSQMAKLHVIIQVAQALSYLHSSTTPTVHLRREWPTVQLDVKSSHISVCLHACTMYMYMLCRGLHPKLLTVETTTLHTFLADFGTRLWSYKDINLFWRNWQQNNEVWYSWILSTRATQERQHQLQSTYM